MIAIDTDGEKQTCGDEKGWKDTTGSFRLDGRFHAGLIREKPG